MPVKLKDVYNNLWYKITTAKTMYDDGAHSSLLALAIIVLGLLEKKDDGNSFAWAVQMKSMQSQFGVTSQTHFNSSKGLYELRCNC